jgi:hypothetical protein
VATAIDSQLSPQRTEIAQALSAWASLGCGGLCFSPPVVSPAASLQEPSTANDSCGPTLVFSAVTAGYAGLHYQVLIDDTQRVVSATVYLAPQTTVADITGYLGGLLLQNTDGPLPQIVDDRGEITPSAEGQFCAIYGKSACQ